MKDSDLYGDCNVLRVVAMRLDEPGVESVSPFLQEVGNEPEIGLKLALSAVDFAHRVILPRMLSQAGMRDPIEVINGFSSMLELPPQLQIPTLICRKEALAVLSMQLRMGGGSIDMRTSLAIEALDSAGSALHCAAYLLAVEPAGAHQAAIYAANVAEGGNKLYAEIFTNFQDNMQELLWAMLSSIERYPAVS
ncbi:MAG: hypothetical protein KBC15_02985 [Candidatus Levybacteria bacterium]|nr:hypothetical protein [Candidatus Levybacteria bacterium]